MPDTDLFRLVVVALEQRPDWQGAYPSEVQELVFLHFRRLVTLAIIRAAQDRVRELYKE